MPHAATVFELSELQLIPAWRLKEEEKQIGVERDRSGERDGLTWNPPIGQRRALNDVFTDGNVL